jgi:hypothetical protein
MRRPSEHEISSLSARIAEFLRHGDKLRAIQEYRRETGYPLQQCMDFVNSILEGIKLSNEGGSVADQAAEVVVPDYVKNVQDIVLETIGKPSGTNPARTSVMQALSSYPRELVLSTLGDFGKHLLGFSALVLADHPSLADINSATLMDGGKVYRRVWETMKIATLGREQGFKEIPAILCNWFNRNHKSISKILLKPPARLLKADSARQAARLLSQPKDVELTQVYEKGRRDTWDTLPDDFTPYTRMGPGFRKEIEYYHRMSSHLKGLGMPHYAKTLEGDVSKFDEVLAGQYMGFIRIRMVDAAIIAAKAMGARWDADRMSRICVTANHFTRAFWSSDPKGKLQTEPMLSDVFDRHVTLDTNYRQSDGGELKLVLTPRVYPLERFGATRSPTVQKLIATLEAHPDTNGHPLFDNYWVIVPSVTVNTAACDTWQFSDNEQTYKFLDYWQYATAVDRYLVQQGQIFPVILGENVSRKACYFVAYWT